MWALCQMRYRATWSTFKFFPCLNKFVPKSAWNDGGTNKTWLFDACPPSREPKLSHQTSQWRKKSRLDRDANPGPLAYHASTLPTTWTTCHIFPPILQNENDRLAYHERGPIHFKVCQYLREIWLQLTLHIPNYWYLKVNFLAPIIGSLSWQS